MRRVNPVTKPLVTVTFTERGDKTELTLHQAVFEDVATRDDHRRGWTSTLQRFAEYLANN
jgi:activator of Hsp90 ATPase-like protein